MLNDNRLFVPDDLEILTLAVSIYPNLEYACFAAKMAKQHLKFPIKSHKDLDELFEIKHLPEKIAERKIGPAHVRKFFPKEFFPIEDVRDFLGKTLAILSWGDEVHYHEQFLKEPERFSQIQYRKEN